MSHKSMLSRTKDVAVETVGLAQRVAGRAVGTVTSLVGGRGEQPADRTSEKRLDISPDEPVNVTEELGLDPAPVERPKAPKAPSSRPVTGIDAQADPDHVHATPADVADAVAKPTPRSTVEE
ncbi:hypothetical protein FHP29_01625 [Nocardioides albidus]|uniref:Uncharacterized protein n=1 Tax=Nocardioides albidus TaxID=1517589 RepID=A0A5C4WPR7_9ACTN|nr:hypothetical protein [Nocardioides albidus]TNM49575.1 hypothetical protein FHP29_01625 [Nocardioides albidus]